MRDAVALGSVLSLFGLLAAAAPILKETNEQQVIRLFGTPVDPNKDCEFAIDGKTPAKRETRRRRVFRASTFLQAIPAA